LEVGSCELTDLNELKSWNLNLEINTTPDLGTLNLSIGFHQKVNFDSSILMNSETKIGGLIRIGKMKNFLHHENLVYHVTTAGSPRILESTFLHPEVAENSKSGPFSRTMTLTLGRTSATVLRKNFFGKRLPPLKNWVPAELEGCSEFDFILGDTRIP